MKEIVRSDVCAHRPSKLCFSYDFLYAKTVQSRGNGMNSSEESKRSSSSSGSSIIISIGLPSEFYKFIIMCAFKKFLAYDFMYTYNLRKCEYVILHLAYELCGFNAVLVQMNCVHRI